LGRGGEERRQGHRQLGLAKEEGKGPWRKKIIKGREYHIKEIRSIIIPVPQTGVEERKEARKEKGGKVTT